MSGRAETTAVIPGRCIISVGRAEMPTPKGWEWFKLTDIARLESGHTPSRRHPEYWDGGVPWIGIKDARLHHGRVIHTTLQTISSSGLENSAARILPAGTVCLSRTASVGYIFVMGKPMATSQDFVNWVCSDRLIPEFFMYALIAEGERLREFGKGTTHTTIYYPEVKAMHICLPKPVEQRRIVAEIEKQFTRLDAGVAALRRTQANLKRYRAAVLKAACEGRLVPTEAELARKESRKFESAAKLIACTKPRPRPNRWNSRSKDLIVGHSALAVGNPNTPLPAGWTWVPLVDIARMESGHTPSRTHPEWWEGDIPWIGIADAREYDGKTILDTFQHTNAHGVANSAARVLPAGTVCISRTASVGYVVVMGREMATSQDFVNWAPTKAVLAAWLRIVFTADREGLRKFGKGSVHKTIYFPEWLSMHIALPPLAEQKRIVAEVDHRLSVIKEVDAAISANLTRSARLTQATLARAFRKPDRISENHSSIRNRTA